MDYSPSKKMIKYLFGRASTCANPECSEPLIIEARGALTVNAQIAHIRSASPDGPRYDESYPAASVNGEANLFLLCLKCHKVVDDHPILYTAKELEKWKALQVAQGERRALTENDVSALAAQLEKSLTKLTEDSLGVDLVGVMLVRDVMIPVPLEHLPKAVVSEKVQARYLGVNIANRGFVTVGINAVGVDLDIRANFDVDSVGIDLDVDGFANPSYVFTDDQPLNPPKMLSGQSSGVWLAHPPTILAGIGVMIRDHLGGNQSRFPRRFRPYVLLGSGSRLEGAWSPIQHFASLISEPE